MANCVKKREPQLVEECGDKYVYIAEYNLSSDHVVDRIIQNYSVYSERNSRKAGKAKLETALKTALTEKDRE